MPKAAAPKAEKEEEVVPLDNLPSMRIGYWMERLASGVEKLSVLDQQVGRIRQVVEEEKKQQEQQQAVVNSGRAEEERGGGKKYSELLRGCMMDPAPGDPDYFVGSGSEHL